MQRSSLPSNANVAPELRTGNVMRDGGANAIYVSEGDDASIMGSI